VGEHEGDPQAEGGHAPQRSLEEEPEDEGNRKEEEDT
jgi:hypothetical protein